MCDIIERREILRESRIHIVLRLLRMGKFFTELKRKVRVYHVKQHANDNTPHLSCKHLKSQVLDNLQKSDYYIYINCTKFRVYKTHVFSVQ